jgi:DNA-binding NarL/FixJ family response regulator
VGGGKLGEIYSLGGEAERGAADEASVLLVDDDSIVHGWVRLSLDGTEFRLTAEASSKAEAIDLVRRRRPDIMLVDFHLPDGIGTDLVRHLRRMGFALPAVVTTGSAQKGFNEAAREAGAQGTILMSGNLEELLGALRTVLAGEESFDARHPEGPPLRGALSPREREILRMVAAGSTNKEIAAALSVGDETVKTLLARTFAKLGVRRRAEAVSEAHKRGLI